MVLKDRFYRIEAKGLKKNYIMDYAGKKEIEEMICLGKESAKKFLADELKDGRPGVVSTFLDEPVEKYERVKF